MGAGFLALQGSKNAHNLALSVACALKLKEQKYLKLNQRMLLSDELLLNYKRCQRRAFLELYGDASQQDSESEFVHKLRRENRKQIHQVLSQKNYYQPDASWQDFSARATQTQTLMQQGVDCIYQGVLWQPGNQELVQLLENLTGKKLALNYQDITLVGKPNLLVKQPGKSKFGNWQYVPISIKLGRRPKPEYKLVGAFHAYLLAALQQVLPSKSSLILRQLKTYHVNLDIWLLRLQEILHQCLEMLSSQTEPEVFISRQRCGLCQWHSYCYGIAQSQKHLSLVPGVTPKRYQDLQAQGITSLELLAGNHLQKISEEVSNKVTSQLKRQAQSILENRPLLKLAAHRGVKIPTATIELYFDIEAEPELNLDYLLGVLLVNHQNNMEQFYAFLAKKPEEEQLIWQEFLEFVELYHPAPIFHFSEYEVEAIKRLANVYQTPQVRIDKIIHRLVDVHRYVMLFTTLPVENYSLKSLANWLGFQWRDQGVSGEQCICWYDEWLTSQKPELIESIVRYNEDDCAATRVLKEWLVEFLPTVQLK